MSFINFQFLVKHESCVAQFLDKQDKQFCSYVRLGNVALDQRFQITIDIVDPKFQNQTFFQVWKLREIQMTFIFLFKWSHRPLQLYKLAM